LRVSINGKLILHFSPKREYLLLVIFIVLCGYILQNRSVKKPFLESEAYKQYWALLDKILEPILHEKPTFLEDIVKMTTTLRMLQLGMIDEEKRQRENEGNVNEKDELYTETLLHPQYLIKRAGV